PENILFTKEGAPLVADLGIGKRVASTTQASESITEPGSFLGTPAYMAPEQMDCSKSVTAKVDVYALGVILYECLAGRPPFDGESLAEIVARATKGRAVRIQALRPETPDALARAIEAALERKPSRRLEDGFALAHALGAPVPERAPERARPEAA